MSESVSVALAIILTGGIVAFWMVSLDRQTRTERTIQLQCQARGGVAVRGLFDGDYACVVLR